MASDSLGETLRGIRSLPDAFSADDWSEHKRLILKGLEDLTDQADKIEAKLTTLAPASAIDKMLERLEDLEKFQSRKEAQEKTMRWVVGLLAPALIGAAITYLSTQH